MGLFGSNSDPIKDRERDLERQMRALQDKISTLDQVARDTEQQPRVRSTVRPRQLPSRNPFQANQEVVFESVEPETPAKPKGLDVTPAHYNEYGVKKFDLIAFGRRLQQLLRQTPRSQSKFVNYLAAGSIQGMRPLRYERRIARNRFLLMFAVVLLGLFGIFMLWQGRL